MKSKLIRFFAVLASVLVLAVALVVPSFADGIDGGYIDPVTFEGCRYLLNDVPQFTDVTLGDSVVFGSLDSVEFVYYVVVDTSSLQGVSFSYSGSEPLIFRYNYAGTYYSRVFSKFNCDGTNCEYQYLDVGTVTAEDKEIDVSGYDTIEFMCNGDFLSLLADCDYTYYTLKPEPIFENIGDVWTSVVTFITSGLNSVQGVFYANNQLTMLGTLAVIGVAIAVAFLLVGVLQRFLHLRG